MNVLSYVIILMQISIYKTDDEVTVKTEQGFLQGTVQKTRNGRSIYAFQGIPFAEPPVGNLRFEAPLPGKPWKGILKATKEHTACVQVSVIYRNYSIVGDEDCLYLNVYTPKISTDLLPVIVYIHGGGFVMGNANPSLRGPYYLLDKDLVFVGINYRLGPLGFLSTGDTVVPGNNGLKDQSLALKWVRNNIKQFGGDPEKITISGQSAGAASAYYHLLSPLSKDIPFAAIALSGVTPSLWSLAQEGEAKRNSQRLAKGLNCPITSSQRMIDCMKNISSYSIIGETIKFMVFNYDPFIPYKPVVEPYSKTAFLPEHPVNIIKSGKMSQVPFMTGITTEDGAMKSPAVYHNSSLVEILNRDFNEILPIFAHYDEVGFDTSKISTSIRKFYFKDKDISGHTKAELTDLVTDILFYVPARLTSVLHAKHSTKPVYFYLFGYKGSTSYSKLFGDPAHDYGVSHCDDLLYLLPNSYIKYKPSAEDIKMIEVMTTLWYNFASTGNPTPELNSVISTKWYPVVTDDLEYYFIKNSTTFEMLKNLYEDRFQFWKKLAIFNTVYKPKDEL